MIFPHAHWTSLEIHHVGNSFCNDSAFFFIQKLYFAPDVLFKKGESSIFRQDIGDTDVGVLVW